MSIEYRTYLVQYESTRREILYYINMYGARVLLIYSSTINYLNLISSSPHYTRTGTINYHYTHNLIINILYRHEYLRLVREHIEEYTIYTVTLTQACEATRANVCECSTYIFVYP